MAELENEILNTEDEEREAATDVYVASLEDENKGVEEPLLIPDTEDADDVDDTIPFEYFSPDERQKIISTGAVAAEAEANEEEMEAKRKEAEMRAAENEEKRQTENIDVNKIYRETVNDVAAQQYDISDSDSVSSLKPVAEEKQKKEDTEDNIFDTGGVDFSSGEINGTVGKDASVDIGSTVGGKQIDIKHYTPKKIMLIAIIVIAGILGLINLSSSLTQKNYDDIKQKKLLGKDADDKKGLQASKITDDLLKSEEQAIAESNNRSKENMPSDFDPTRNPNDSDATASIRAGYGNSAGQNADGVVYVDQNGNPVAAGNGASNGGLTPNSGGAAPQNDPVREQREAQRAALRQQYIDLIKQSYTSKPSVDGGNWGKQDNNKQNSVTTASDSVIPARPQSSSPTQKIADALGFKNEQEMINHFSGGGGAGGSSASTVAAAFSSNSKETFFNNSSSGKGYLSNTRTDKISPYTLPSGTMIPCALLTGINSDLPGNITASVTENVYDWQSANICLIPQGTRVFGTYSSNIAFGQKRVQVSWQRLIFPDGSTISLEGMSGVDRRGYSGLRDKTYNHYGKMLVATVMTTAFSILPALVENRSNNSSVYYGTSARETAAAAAAQHIGQMGNKFFDKSLNVNPTILVRPGTRFNIQVNADIPFYRKWRIVRAHR